jgi:hypothetical protein
LIVLTVVTGMVDALAYLRLEHVFVANMTGYVVFLGFAAAEAGGLGAGVAASAGAVPGSLLASVRSLPAVSPRGDWADTLERSRRFPPRLRAGSVPGLLAAVT